MAVLLCHTQDLHAIAQQRQRYEIARAAFVAEFRALCRLTDDPADAQAEIVLVSRAMLDASQ